MTGTHYDIEDLRPAPAGWTVHSYYREKDGSTHHERLPLAGWAVMVQDRDDVPRSERRQRVEPAWWETLEGDLLTPDDEVDNGITLITGPGQDEPDRAYAEEALTRRIKAREADRRRRAQLVEAIIAAVTAAGDKGITLPELTAACHPTRPNQVRVCAEDLYLYARRIERRWSDGRYVLAEAVTA